MEFFQWKLTLLICANCQLLFLPVVNVGLSEIHIFPSSVCLQDRKSDETVFLFIVINIEMNALKCLATHQWSHTGTNLSKYKLKE
jgi:hypothetical protein